MKSTYHPLVHRFAVFTVCWTVLLLVAGALVTSKDAALSVTDWPRSHGVWIPATLAGGDLYEYSHRVVAGALGIFTLILAVLVWVKDERRWLRWFAVIALGGIVAQAILGGQVVIQLLHYWLPVMHACFAQIMFGAILSIAVFTSNWWVSERPQLEDKGSPAIHSVALINAVVIFLQVFLGAGFRHKDISIWPHAVGSLVVLGTVVWTAIVLRKRFEQSREFTLARILLHSVFGLQFLLGLGAFWSRASTADAPQPMPVMVTLTVIHTVVGALLFAVSIFTILLCYRLVPRGREVAVRSEGQVTA
jgi:cytochrome c oxidase assembly protein subunit 15